MRRLCGGATAAVAAAFLSAVAGGAAAQTLEERIGGYRDWSVYEHGSGADRVCWISTTPMNWEARRGGQRVEARRGGIYLNVAVRPGQGVANEPSFVAGYPLRDQPPVRVAIGDAEFDMFAVGEFAWPEDASADDSMVAAMRSGAQAVVTGVSSRGTTTVDTFSLMGFTAALDAARAACAE
jgi:invasion protein IalB